MGSHKLFLGNRRRLLLITWFSLIGFSVLYPVYAKAYVVTPNEGTFGTTFTISGEHFGAKGGTVFIGPHPCQVVGWKDTEVKCLIKEPIKTGSYDVKLNLQGRLPSVILKKAFTIKAPKLDPPTHRPHFVSPGDIATVSGTFLGNGIGRQQVEIANLRGDKKLCRILGWTMNSVTFELPHNIPGIFHVRVINAVGSDTQPWWGTFARLPTNLPNLLGSTITGVKTHENAAAVVYNGQIWAFYPHVNDDDNKIAYRKWDGKNYSGLWSDGVYLTTVSPYNDVQKSKAQINPLVAEEILYVFYTGKDKKLYYLKLDFVAADDNIVPDPDADPSTVEKIWQPEQAIPGVTVEDLEGRFAAVYNFTSKCIEIYYTPDSIRVYMKKYFVGTRTWTEAIPVGLPRASTYIAPYLTAVFNQLDDGSYVTYLSYADGSAGYLAELKDGGVIRYHRNTNWQPVDVKRGPSLADLGNDHLAVIYNSNYYRSQYDKYNKNTYTFSSPISVPYKSDQETAWAPNGITFSYEEEDVESPTGFRMNSKFYVFAGNNAVAQDTRWQFVDCELLGYWLPTGDTDVNFSDRVADTFPLWPLVGVIDMPPYVRNNHECQMDEFDTCLSDVEYGFAQSTLNGMSVEGSAGGYVRTRARTPVEFSMSSGYTGGHETSTTFTYEQADRLDAGREGKILAYFYVPKFKVTELEWHDLSGYATGLKTESWKVTGAEIRKSVFNPIDGPTEWQTYWAAINPGVARPPYLDPAVFPSHESEVVDPQTNQERPESDMERLLTYCKNPVGYEQVGYGTTDWFPESSGFFSWAISKESTTNNGFYLDMKLGGKGPIVIGVEGSFKLQVITTTQNDVKAITNVRGPSFYDSNYYRIIQYHAAGYWLKPNVNSYWVPDYRKIAGDKPWFITYKVTDAWLHGNLDPVTHKYIPVPFYPSCP
ncbi:MAG: IPT/TIG domain-containing protein [Deltaproteobacteria bacterium]|nr:IPT/TIG domain-containing protein [Deltaproteobacteria bacterium]